MKNFNQVLVGLIALILTAAVLAKPPENRPPDNRPPDKGGSHGAVQSNTQNTTTTVGSNSNSNSSSSASGGSATAQGGESSSSSSSTGGSASSSGGSANSHIDVDVEGDVDDYPASSAPTAVASYCTNAAGGQAMGGGASIGTQDPICQHFEVANRMLIAWKQERETCKMLAPECDEGLVRHYYQQYTNNLLAAERIMDQTSVTGQISKTAGQLVLPAALIWLVFLL